MAFILSRFKQFFDDITGNTATIFALCVPFMLTLGSAAIDFAAYSGANSQFQEIADTAALSGAQQFALSMDHQDDQQGTTTMEAVARNTAERMLANMPQGSNAIVSVAVDMNEFTVTVGITQFNTTSILGNFIGNTLDIDVEAVALSVGSGKTCVISLNETQNQTLTLRGTAQISGNDCGIFVNSEMPNSLSVQGGAQITANKICSVGGYIGSNYFPTPIEGCPLQPDPVEDRDPRDGIDTPEGFLAFSEIEDCDEEEFVVSTIANELTPLDPGTYCNGLTFLGDGTVIMMNGIYTIKDGPFTISDRVNVVNINATTYFLGDNANLMVGPQTSLNMSAPKEGEMAGILFFQDREANDDSKFEIQSNDARELVGTIYLPKGTLYIDTNAKVAQESAYTAIIANKVEITNNANLVLNSDYSATDVPVPKGISGDNPLRLLR